MTTCELYFYDQLVKTLQDGNLVLLEEYRSVYAKHFRRGGMSWDEDIAVRFEDGLGASQTFMMSWLAARLHLNDGKVLLRSSGSVETHELAVSRITFLVPQAGMTFSQIFSSCPLSVVRYTTTEEDASAVPSSTWESFQHIHFPSSLSVSWCSLLETVLSSFQQQQASAVPPAFQFRSRQVFWVGGSRPLPLLEHEAPVKEELLSIQPEGALVLFVRTIVVLAGAPERSDAQRTVLARRRRRFLETPFVHPGSPFREPVVLVAYIEHVASRFHYFCATYHLLATLLAQSSGTGKSRAVTECLKRFPGAYMCFRRPDDRFPIMNHWSALLFGALRFMVGSDMEDKDVVMFTAKFLLSLVLAVKQLQLQWRDPLPRLHSVQLADMDGSAQADQNELFRRFKCFLRLLLPVGHFSQGWFAADASLTSECQHFLVIAVLRARLPACEADFRARAGNGVQYARTLEEVVAATSCDQLGLVCCALLSGPEQSSDPERRMFLLAVDEVQLLVEEFDGEARRGQVAFHYLLKALTAFRHCRMLTLFLGTQAVAHDLYAERFSLAAPEIPNLLPLLPPIVPLEYFDLFPESKMVFDAATLLSVFSSTSANAVRMYKDRLALLGRPLWEAVGFEESITEAASGLGEATADGVVDASHWVALFSAGPGIAITPSTSLAAALVQSRMAWLLFVDPRKRAGSHCAYSSEPALALAACRDMFWRLGADQFSAGITALKWYVATGELEKGEIGEFVCRLLVLAGMYRAPLQPEDFLAVVPVRRTLQQFLRNLFGSTGNCDPDWLKLVLDHLEARYESAHVSFSHFVFPYIKSEDFVVSEEVLLTAMTRNAALMTPLNYPGLDGIIPFVGRLKGATGTQVAYVGLQFKNLAKADMESPGTVADRIIRNQQAGPGVENPLNIAIQVGSQEASIRAQGADAQRNDLAGSRRSFAKHMFVPLHLSPAVAVLRLKAEHAERGHRSLYLHVHGRSLVSSSLPAVSQAADRDLEAILFAQRDFTQFLLELLGNENPGALYRRVCHLREDLDRMFPFRKLGQPQ